MNLLEEDDSNVTIEILKAKALATANNNSLRTTIKEEPQDNYDLQTSTQTDSETKQVVCIKCKENSMRPNKRPCLNLLSGFLVSRWQPRILYQNILPIALYLQISISTIKTYSNYFSE